MLNLKRLFLCGVFVLVAVLLSAPPTQAMQAYEGLQLAKKDIAQLELQPFSLGRLGDPVPKIYLRAIDGRHDPKWNESPDFIELLPGIHSLYLEAFYPSSRPELRPSYIGEATVVFNAEAGREYKFNLNYRSSGDGFLRGTVVDWTAGNKVVFPQKYKPVPFPLSNIPRDKTVVCFYREWKLVSAAVDFYVSERNKDINILENGSLFYHVTTPGSHPYAIGFAGKGKSTHFILAPGVITYLRASVYDGKLSAVPESEAIKEIKGLKSESAEEISKPPAAIVKASDPKPLPFSLSEIPKDKAVVCFFMKESFSGGNLNLWENNKKFQVLDNGYYLYHITTPGSHTYEVGDFFGKRKELTIDLNPGTISYIRASFPVKLTFTEESLALNQIRELKLSR